MTSLNEKIAAATDPNSLEEVFASEGIHRVVGVDEVGRGPLAGPITVGALCLKLPVGTFDWEKEIRDSKKLTENKRERLFEELQRHTTYSVAETGPADIDAKGVTEANDSAMRRAIACVLRKLADAGTPPDLILIDGNRVPTGIKGVSEECLVMALPKADNRCLRVGAASIVAKVLRDDLMVMAHNKWPEYEFHKNKGYGTKAHCTAIEEHGPCPIHRKTFGRVREYLQQ